MQVNKWAINRAEIIDESSLLISFNKHWFQEDLKEIRKCIFLTIQHTTKIEDILGADRENTRFMWHNQEFTLNFECYSQSCWIELAGKTDKSLLNELKTIFVKSV